MNIIYTYVKDRKHRVVGVVLASGPSEIGYAMYNPKAPECKELRKDILVAYAMDRAKEGYIKNRRNLLSLIKDKDDFGGFVQRVDLVLCHMERMLVRAHKYFWN